MMNIESIVARVEQGEKLRFYQDYYGRQWIELTRGTFLRKREKIRLEASEIAALKSALASRNSGRERRTG